MHVARPQLPVGADRDADLVSDATGVMGEEWHRTHAPPVTEADIQPVLEPLLTVARQLLRGRHATASALGQVTPRHPHGVKPPFSPPQRSGRNPSFEG